jgi:TPP-dependent 2-oxoacid decarboxylase
LHHTLGDYQIPLRIYEKITAASTQLVSAEMAPAEIDRVLSACLSHKPAGLHQSPSGRGDDEMQPAGRFPLPDARLQ